MGYTGRLRWRGIPFSGFRYIDERIGISPVEAYERVGNYVNSVLLRPKRTNRCILCLYISWPEIPDNATAHARSYLAIWPPNTQRKSMAKIKQNKIEQVLAYREEVPRCGRVLESFLRYSD